MVKDADHNSTLSSIALLQERFRQLQRMKELREQRDQLKRSSTLTSQECRPRSAAFSGGARPTPTTTPPSHCQLALSLWPDYSQTKRSESYISSPAQLVCTSPQFNLLQSCDSEIDTSLRL